VVQGISDKYWQAEARTEETKRFIRNIKRITRRKFLKDFMEAGKERLTRDAARVATRGEFQELKHENARLKQLVAELSLQVHVLKKTAVPELE